ncbi:MAG: sulfatase-like hydrolase/transferase [Planctomycetes bacterium]|nr:sulfatase-like hydrolase/transferase [Planctomycetota bacterium]
MPRTIFAAILALVVFAGPLAGQEDERPNILFILTDDHRPDGMGCYGNESIRTPNFDRIAAEGARLDSFYVAAPLCCPSRAAFLSGLWPHQNGVMNNQGGPDLAKGTPTIATALAHAGYVTGFVGKAHMGGDPRRWDFSETPVWLPGGGSKHEDPTLFVDGERKNVEGLVTQIFADAATRWIEEHKEDRWFLWLATTSPHKPYLRDPDHPYRLSEIRPPPLWPEGEPLSDADWEGYYSTISMLDAEVGRVLAKLAETGQLDRTFIFVAGDNGFMHGSHGYPAKSVWFEEATRVPALARWPGRIRAGTAVKAPIVAVDLFPTLSEIAGAPVPEGLEATSMLPALTGGEPRRKIAGSELAGGRRGVNEWQMVRSDDLKYVREGSGAEHLYDLVADPDEGTDLAKDSKRAKDLERMREVHAKWLADTPK